MLTSDISRDASTQAGTTGLKPHKAKVAMIVWNEFRNDARVLKEAQTLQSSGYKVSVFALHTPGKTEQSEVLDGGIQVTRIPRSPAQALMSIFSGRRSKASDHAVVSGQPRSFILRALKRIPVHFALIARMVASRPDVVHAHDINTLPTAFVAARLTRARLIYDAHEISVSREGYERIRKLVGFLEACLIPRVDAMITTTTTRAKFFARAYGVPRPLVLQNRPRLTDVPRSSRIRDELRLREEWPVVLYQGGLQQGRGLDRLVRIAAQVPGAYFVLIGGGLQEANLRSLAKDLHLENRVRFIPTVSLKELPHYTSSGDVGVQPIENTCFNHYTTDSNKLFEYVMGGLPVIASRLPEISRLVNAHDLGLLVEPGDDRTLVDALNRMVREPTLRRRFSASSRAAAKVLNWETQEQELVTLYGRVLANRERGHGPRGRSWTRRARIAASKSY